MYPKWDQETGEWKRLKHRELTDLKTARNIIRVIESRRIKWAGYVLNMVDRRSANRISGGKEN